MEEARYVQHPRYKALILRRTFPQLQEIIDRCQQWYPQVSISANYKATEHRWHFPSGAIIQLGHMQHENDKYRYHGQEIHRCGFDELTMFTESQYLFMHSRVRSTVPEIPTQILSTTNPGNIGHMWVKGRFVDVSNPKKPYIDPITGQSRVFIPAKVTDNPTLVENDPLYIQRLEALPEVEKLRLLHGVWDVFEGQVFTELSQRVHGCDDFPIPPEWTHWMTFDWGYARPWCALWFAEDFDGVIYLYREKYGMKGDDPNLGVRQTNTEICREIVDIEREKMKYRVADPACWSPTKIKGSNQVHGPSFVEDAGKERLYFMKADNDRIRGKQQIHQRLMLDEEDRPQFVIFKSCKNWWREFQNLYEDPKNPEDCDTDQPDEGYDCTRYSLLSRPLAPKKRVVIPPGSFTAERNKYIRAKEYAKRYGISMAAAYARIR